MTPEQIKIIEEIAVHSKIIENLTSRLLAVAPLKKRKGEVSEQEIARFKAKLRKSMYKEK